jgi:hypothetical protein
MGCGGESAPLADWTLDAVDTANPPPLAALGSLQPLNITENEQSKNRTKLRSFFISLSLSNFKFVNR